MEIETINLVIAVIGAVTGPVGLCLSIILGIAELRRNQPRFKVTTSTLQLFDPNTGKSFDFYLTLSLANIGTRPIVINSYSLIDKRKHVHVLPDLPIEPVRLEDGQGYEFPIPAPVLAANGFINDLVAVRVVDATGKAWTGKISRANRKWVMEVAGGK